MSVYLLAAVWEMPNIRDRCSGSGRPGDGERVTLTEIRTRTPRRRHSPYDRLHNLRIGRQRSMRMNRQSLLMTAGANRPLSTRRLLTANGD